MRAKLLILITGLSLLLSCKKVEKVNPYDRCKNKEDVTAKFRVSYISNVDPNPRIYTDTINQKNFFVCWSDMSYSLYSYFEWYIDGIEQASQGGNTLAVNERTLSLGSHTIRSYTATTDTTTCNIIRTDTFERVITIVKDDFTLMTGTYAAGINYEDTIKVYYEQPSGVLKAKVHSQCVDTFADVREVGLYDIELWIGETPTCGTVIYSINSITSILSCVYRSTPFDSDNLPIKRL